MTILSSENGSVLTLTESDIELGERQLPRNWKIIPLEEATLITEFVNPSAEPERTFKYIDVSAVSKKTLEITNFIEYNGNNAPSRARKRIRAGDVLFATVRPSLKRVALVPPEFDGQVCSTAFCVARANPKLADARYLFYAITNDDFVRRVSSKERGISYPAVTDKDVLTENIILPPLIQQREIARILTAIRRAERTTRDVISQSVELENSVTEFFFGDSSKANADWPRFRLRELGEFVNGYAFKPEEWGVSGKPIIRIQNLNDLRKPFNYFSGNLDQRHLVKSGDILVSWSASLGVFKWTLDEAWLNQHIFKANIDHDKVDPDFFYWAMKKEIKRIGMLAHGSTMHHVTRGLFLDSTIPLPPLKKQREVALILSTIAKKITADKDWLARLSELYQTLLHELLSGKSVIPHKYD